MDIVSYSSHAYLHVIFVHGKDPLTEALRGLGSIANFYWVEIGVSQVDLSNLLHDLDVDMVLWFEGIRMRRLI